MRRPLLAVLCVSSLLAGLHCKETKEQSVAPSTSTPAPASASASAATTAARPKHSGPVKAHPAPEASVVVSEPSDAPGAGKASAASVGLPTVDFGPAGPLTIKGYPTELETGMRDYATLVGYSKDSGSAIACGHLTPMGEAKGAELADTCFFNKGGKTERAAVEENATGPFVGAALAEQLKLVREGGATPFPQNAAGNAYRPHPLKATWPFAKDLVLSLTTLEGKDGNVALRVGGSVGGGDTVYPVTMAILAKFPDLPYGGTWNAVTTSPDGKELAFVGHFYCMEWCNELVITRMSYARLAGLVFNDSGFRLHQKKDYAGSRDLFLKATWANPDAPLPPYNLACAYALLGDATNAEKALKLAISVGGPTVKERAKKDADFKAVVAAKWFKGLTG